MIFIQVYVTGDKVLFIIISKVEKVIMHNLLSITHSVLTFNVFREKIVQLFWNLTKKREFTS